MWKSLSHFRMFRCHDVFSQVPGEGSSWHHLITFEQEHESLTPAFGKSLILVFGVLGRKIIQHCNSFENILRKTKVSKHLPEFCTRQSA